MKKLVICFLSAILIHISFPLQGQQNKIDSLIIVLKTAKDDTSKVNSINMLSKLYSNIGSYESAMQYAQQAFKLSDELYFKKGITAAYNNLGVVYWNQGNYKKALDYFSKSLIINEEIGNKKGLAIGYNNIGLVFLNQGDYEKALESFLKSLKIKEAIGDKQGIGMSYLNMGNIYLSQGNYEKALELFSKSLKINIETGNKKYEATNLNNIGIIAVFQGNSEKALEYYLKGLKIHVETDDKKGIAMSYNNIGLIYYEKGNYTKALDNQLKSLEINEEIGDIQGAAVSYTNIGNIYIKQKKFDESFHYLDISLNLLDSVGFKVGIKDAFLSLSDLFDKKGDYKQAYNYHILYSNIKDTLLNEQSSKQIAEMNTKYDSEKKDKELLKKDLEISKQLVETEKKQLQRNVFIIGFALVLALSFFIFKVYRNKRNANILLEKKNSLIENQKQLVEEKSKKITDSIIYAKRIQQAILPSRDLIKSLIPDSFVFFKPKDIVSGDFYWIHAIDEDQVMLAVVDCTGHGVPGALMSMMGFNLLEQIVKEHQIYEPGIILDELSKLVIDSLKQTNELSSVKEGMDIALLKINNRTMELEFAGARNSIYLVRNEKLSELKADRRSIGGALSHAVPFSNYKIKVQKGDCLYAFSDGYADQFGGPDNEKFYYHPFRELLTGISQQSMEEQEEKLEKVILEWKGQKAQIDDMLVIGVRV